MTHVLAIYQVNLIRVNKGVGNTANGFITYFRMANITDSPGPTLSHTRFPSHCISIYESKIRRDGTGKFAYDPAAFPADMTRSPRALGGIVMMIERVICVPISDSDCLIHSHFTGGRVTGSPARLTTTSDLRYLLKRNINNVPN